MSGETQEESTSSIELLHPFYLDTDMSMAFAAALAGGVALEREDVSREAQESEAVRKLRGNLRLFGALGIGAGAARIDGERSKTESESATIDSRLVRQHTEASIFIALHDELRRTNRIADANDVESLRPGDLVSASIGPAVAPLRRLVDQLIRLLDITMPMVGLSPDDGGTSQSHKQQARRQQARPGNKPSTARADQDSDAASLYALRGLLIALKDDLDQSGMVDVVVVREDRPSIVLTLDKRFMSDQSLELLHTSRFTVVGKVTELWSSDGFVNLYRRSVLALIPALVQTVGWGMFSLLATLASSLDPAAAQRAAARAAGQTVPDVENKADANPDPEQKPEPTLSDEAIKALSPAVSAPAIQVLPLAICA